jgi:hypothetical protein
MKTLKTLLLILALLGWSLPLFAANPSYTSFLGTNNITVRSNSPSGAIIIDGAYYYSTSDFVATNSTANSNQTVNFKLTLTREIFLTNNISITNFTGYANGMNALVKWKLVPQLVNRTVVWPTGSQFGISLGTNQGSTLWTTLTNGVTYQVAFDSWNTNIDITIAAFYR